MKVKDLLENKVVNAFALFLQVILILFGDFLYIKIQKSVDSMKQELYYTIKIKAKLQ